MSNAFSSIISNLYANDHPFELFNFQGDIYLMLYKNDPELLKTVGQNGFFFLAKHFVKNYFLRQYN